MKVRVNYAIGIKNGDMWDYNPAIDEHENYMVRFILGIPIVFTGVGRFKASKGDLGFLTTSHAFNRFNLGQEVSYKTDFEKHIWKPVGVYIAEEGEYAIVRLHSGISFHFTRFEIATKEELDAYKNTTCYTRTWQTRHDTERENIDKCVLNDVFKSYMFELTPAPGEKKLATYGDSGGLVIKKLPNGTKKILGLVNWVDDDGHYVHCLKAHLIMDYFSESFKLYRS